MFFSIISTLVLGSLIGSIVAFSVYGFISLIELLSLIFKSQTSNISSLIDIQRFPYEFLIYFIAIPTLVGLFVGYLRNLGEDKRWHGPPDVILAAHLKNNPLNIKTGFLTSFASILSISVGGSVGAYGPLVHFGATIGAEIKDLLYKMGDNQIFLGCGVAAAISSGFGAPLAGLIFAREVILRHQSLASFAPILVSSLVSYFITKFFFGFEPIFPSDIGGVNSLKEFPALVISGIISGLVAVIYIKGLTHKKFFPNITYVKPIYQPAIAALICVMVGIYIPEVLGLGLDTVTNVINGEIFIKSAIYFLIFKLLLTVICLRMGLIGGVFAPALFIGGCVGVILGTIFQFILPDTNLALFAIASIAAVGSCVIGGPAANMMIIFELTSDYQATLAAGVSIVFASLISSKIIGQSVFDKVLLNRNIDITIGDENLILKNLKVKEIFHKDFCILNEDETVEYTIDKLAKKEFAEGYLIDKNNILINKFELSKLLTLKNKSQSLKSLKNNRFLKLNENDNIFNAIDKCKTFVGESIPVIGNKNKMLGVIGESDLLKIILDVNNNQRKLEFKN